MWLFRLLSVYDSTTKAFQKMLWLMASTVSINQHFHRVFEKWDALKSKCWWRYVVWIMCQCLLDSWLGSNRKDPDELYLSSNFLFQIVLCNTCFLQWSNACFLQWPIFFSWTVPDRVLQGSINQEKSISLLRKQSTSACWILVVPWKQKVFASRIYLLKKMGS